MGSNVKKMGIFMVLIMFLAVIGIVVYDKRDSFQRSEEVMAEAEPTVAEEILPEGQIGSDTRAFLTDETFFDPEEPQYSSVEVVEGRELSILMTSVEKDLRIQIIDNAGKLVTGQNFCVVLNKEDEYTDEDKDGVIYIDHLRAGDYSVGLKEVEGYIVPSTEATINVKQNIEYVAIEDIQLLILSEKDVNAQLEDQEVNAVMDDVDKTEIKKLQEGNVNAKLGIDVSKWNKEIDWDKVKNAGVDYAIIRVGYRGATTGSLIEDPYFEKNIKGATAAGLPVGVYFFTQAVSEVEAVEEASAVIELCKNYKIDYPVFIDSESLGGNGRADALDGDMRTKVCMAFCKTVEAAGYRAGVYASRNWLNEMLDMDQLDDYVVWLAEYRDVPLYQGYYHMWQYTSKGSIDGIEGNVDLNLSYLKIDNKTYSSKEDEKAESASKKEEKETEADENSDSKNSSSTSNKNTSSSKNTSNSNKSSSSGSSGSSSSSSSSGGSSSSGSSGSSGGYHYPDTYAQDNSSNNYPDTYAPDNSYNYPDTYAD